MRTSQITTAVPPWLSHLEDGLARVQREPSLLIPRGIRGLWSRRTERHQAEKQVAEGSSHRLGQEAGNEGQEARDVQKLGQILVPGHEKQSRGRERHLQEVRAGHCCRSLGVSPHHLDISKILWRDWDCRMTRLRSRPCENSWPLHTTGFWRIILKK